MDDEVAAVEVAVARDRREARLDHHREDLVVQVEAHRLGVLDHLVATLDADLLDGQEGSYYRAWGNITGMPGGFSDGVDNTGGSGTVAAGTSWSVPAVPFDAFSKAGKRRLP